MIHPHLRGAAIHCDSAISALPQLMSTTVSISGPSATSALLLLAPAPWASSDGTEQQPVDAAPKPQRPAKAVLLPWE